MSFHAASAALILALTAACGIPPRVVPTQTGKSNTRPHPTPERIQALMADASDYVPDLINEITLSTIPRATLKGGHVWAICLVPRHYDAGRIELRADGKSINNPLDRMETRMLVGPVPCGGVPISCTVTTFRGTEVRSLQLATGDCDG